MAQNIIFPTFESYRPVEMRQLVMILAGKCFWRENDLCGKMILAGK
jgi:hypothetical protein